MFANHHQSIRRSLRWATVVLLATGLLGAFGCSKSGSEADTNKEPVAEGVEHTFTMKAFINGYKGVGGDIDGKTNPTLEVKKGDKVTIKLINGENMAHDVKLDAYGVKSDSIMKVDEETEISFVAKGSDDYYCSIPGHRQAGMVGQLKVTDGEKPVVAQADSPDSPAGNISRDLKEAQTVSIDEIGWDAKDVPAPINRDSAEEVEFVIETEEVIAELEDGTTYEMWTYDGKVPGPMLRAREGDTVTVHVDNAPDSSMSHSIDFHAVTGPGGGAAVLQVPPGERRSLTFKALKAGLYVYHCATPHIPTHLARGMYGMILIEPKEGLPEVDHEFYVMQGEYYTTAKPGTEGHQVEDADRMFWEMPTYVVFNGRFGSLTGERALKAQVGETVRFFFGVGGPNTMSSFHVIGEIFDRVWKEAAIVDEPAHNVQTTVVPPGGATMVEFELDYPGKYILVDHALSRMDKGAIGILDVDGEADPSIFKGSHAPTGH
ncbi:MAG: copper-containing nitrite reductase [Myxococcota bacterium]